MLKNDFFSLYIFFISLVFTQLPRTPNHFLLPRHWTRDRHFGLATATLDPRPATRDPRLLVKLGGEWRDKRREKYCQVLPVSFFVNERNNTNTKPQDKKQRFLKLSKIFPEEKQQLVDENKEATL